MMGSDSLLNFSFLLAFFLILLFFGRRNYRKRKEIKDATGVSKTVKEDNYKRKELQDVDAGAVIIPANPKRTSVHWQKYKTGNALLDAQKLDEAIAVFEELAAIPGEAQTALITLGSCYNLKKDHEKALNCFQRVLEMAPSNFNALLGMAGANYHLKHYPTALMYYKKAQALRPDIADGYWGLACAYHMLKEKELASENAKIFIKMVPDSRYRKHLEGMIIS